MVPLKLSSQSFRDGDYFPKLISLRKISASVAREVSISLPHLRVGGAPSGTKKLRLKPAMNPDGSDRQRLLALARREHPSHATVMPLRCG